MNTHVPTPTFRKIADMMSTDLVVKPLIEAYLYEAKFPDVFTVTFRKAGAPRKPDGYFHPSTHPLWSERQLYYYLTDPDGLVPEQLEYESRMAVTMGTAVHDFIEVCMIDAGWLEKPSGVCDACERPHGRKKGQCAEHGALDRDLGRRGHMDGILHVSGWGRGLYEAKTINPMAARDLKDNDIEWLKTKKPEYYAQLQEYMDIKGFAKAMIMFFVLGYPWKIVEIEVPYDPGFAQMISDKYRRVRQAVADGVPPDACCTPLSKEAKACFAREVCPIGRIRR